MTDLALINKELEDVVASRNLLREKHKGATMPEEARAQDAQLTERAQKLTFLIEEEKQKQRDAVFENTVKFLEDPQYQIPRAVNDDDEGRKTLEKAGWVNRAGFICRMTSSGKELAMYPEEVLYGPMPKESEDAVAAAYTKQVRAIFQPEYKAAFTKWLRDKSRNDSLAYARLTSQEQNALSEGVDTAGGFMVPPDIQAELLARTAQSAVVRSMARIVPTSRDEVRFPTVEAHSTSGSIYSSGFVGGWVGETPAFSETDPTFGQMPIAVKKARAATKLSNDWLADAAVNMLAFLAQNGGENLGLVEDEGFIAGDGSALKPTGILNAGITTVDVEGSTADTISNTTAATGSAPKLIDLEYAVPSQYANNAQWLMRRSIEGKVRKLVDANGRFLWLSYNDSAFSGTPRTLEGYPVRNSDFVPTDGTNANKVIIFGDFGHYIIAQRTAVSVVVLRERFADTDQTGIIIFNRVGGGVWNTDAFRIGVV